jgi:hypothetical protein
MDDLTSYEPKSSQVLDVDGAWLEVFFADMLPERGEAIAIEPNDETTETEPLHAVVRSHEGGRRVEAMCADAPDWLEAGCSVARTERPVHVDAPSVERLDVDARTFVPAEARPSTVPLAVEPPSFAEIDGTRRPLSTGWEPLDTLVPLVRGGLNLVVDHEPDSSLFDEFCRRAAESTDAEAQLSIAPEPRSSRDREEPWTHVVVPSGGDHGRFVGLRIGLAWAARLRDEGREVLTATELPTPRAPRRRPGHDDPDPRTPSLGEVVDRIASTLVSTDSAPITTMLRLPIADAPEGLDAIVETLDLGDVDAQVLFDDTGHLRPGRSNSDAELEGERVERRRRQLETLHRAEQLRDKRRIMGDVALTDDELEQLDRADRLEARLRPDASHFAANGTASS